jgi:pimeloyl-ACP methyl ester carboxylesterase
MAMTTMRAGTLELEVLRRGTGRPILLIHGVNPISPRAPFVEMLARHGEVIALSHPGFGASQRPADFDTMYDLTNLYHDVLDAKDRMPCARGSRGHQAKRPGNA